MMDYKEIHKRILADVSPVYDRSDGSWSYDVTRAASIGMSNTYTELSNVEAKLDIRNLSGDELSDFVYQRTGLSRKPATYATTDVIITGLAGAVMNVGDTVAALDVFYAATEQLTLDASGNGIAHVQCLQEGRVGNVPVGAINTFPITLPNINTVYNADSVTNGFEQESDDSLRDRYYEFLQLPATSGNKAHYMMWAKEVTGVGEVKVIPTWNGGGTVKVVIADSNGQAASPELIQDVYDHIQSVRPIGATVTVVSAKEKAINIKAKVILAGGYTLQVVTDGYTALVAQYLEGIALNQTYVSQPRLGNLLFETDGIIDYTNFTVNNGIANIPLADEEIPVIGLIELVV